MQIPVTLRAISEDTPGPQWAEVANEYWPRYRAWFVREGEVKRATYLAGERALRKHMPELLPLYEQLVALAGGTDLVARFLSLYRPPTYATGCSQGVWRQWPPLLVRNYDYSQVLWERHVWRTRWLGRTVIGNSDCLWGLVDGMNDAGLAISLAFGGRRVVGDGFGVPLLVRYALQVCSSTAEAVEVLTRIPCHMAYTVTVLDAEAHYATVFLSPDRAPVVTAYTVATNHQGHVEWPEHALSTGSVERLTALDIAANSATATADGFVGQFLHAPVWSGRHGAGAGTLYTACYSPADRGLTMMWPDRSWRQSIDSFQEGYFDVSLMRR